MEHELRSHRVNGICLGDLKLFMLLYADNAVIFAETVLQMALDALSWYCAR